MVTVPFFYIINFFLVNHLSEIISLGHIVKGCQQLPIPGIPDISAGGSGLLNVLKVPGKHGAGGSLVLCYPFWRKVLAVD